MAAAVAILAALTLVAPPAQAVGWNIGKVPVNASCSDPLVGVLKEAGFQGENLREAWAIAMRESRGRARAVSSTDDWGLFQFNRPTWGGQDWWQGERMLDARYNASVAFELSDGGRTWYPWGLTGSGKVSAGAYGAWSDQQVRSWILEPYLRFYDQFPC